MRNTVLGPRIERLCKKGRGTAQRTMVKSTMWLTLGNIVSRILGAAYVIPWYAWMGAHGNEAQYLFSKGYNIYALFLMISTAGIPAAVAKQTARFNSNDDFLSSNKLLKETSLLMVVLGIVFTCVMFISSNSLSQGNKDLSNVIKSLSFVMLIFPVMSVMRGFFQGTNEFKPYALSQIIEQITRIIFMLSTTYYIMKITSGSFKTAILLSTFSAFIGAIFAFLLLLFYLYKNFQRQKLTQIINPGISKFSSIELAKGMVVQAIPFIFIGSGISIFKLIDQYTFEKILYKTSELSTKYIENLFTLLSPNPDKIVMMVISIGTAMATAGLPLITEKYNKQEFNDLRNLVSNNFKLFFLIMTPATIGTIVLSEPLNTLFYQYDLLGSRLLALNCFLGLFMGFFLVCSTMLQGIDGNIYAVGYLSLGLLIKIIFQFPLVYFFQEYGALLSSLLGFLLINFYTVRLIYIRTKFNLLEVLNYIFRIILVSIFMGTFLFFIGCTIKMYFSVIDTKGISLIYIIFITLLGIIFYYVVVKKFGLLKSFI